MRPPHDEAPEGDEFAPEPGSDEWDESTPRPRRWFAKKRYLLPLGLTGLLTTCVILAPDPDQSGSLVLERDAAGLRSGETPMYMEACNQVIAGTADDLDVTPSDIVNTDVMHTVRFRTDKGSVLITCDGLDEKMIVTESRD